MKTCAVQTPEIVEVTKDFGPDAGLDKVKSNPTVAGGSEATEGLENLRSREGEDRMEGEDGGARSDCSTPTIRPTAEGRCAASVTRCDPPRLAAALPARGGRKARRKEMARREAERRCGAQLEKQPPAGMSAGKLIKKVLLDLADADTPLMSKRGHREKRDQNWK